jgi:hypothetical protein
MVFRDESAVEDPTGRIRWQITKRRSPIKKLEEGPEKDLAEDHPGKVKE